MAKYGLYSKYNTNECITTCEFDIDKRSLLPYITPEDKALYIFSERKKLKPSTINKLFNIVKI